MVFGEVLLGNLKKDSYMENARFSFEKKQWSSCVEQCLRAIVLDNTNIEAWGLCAISYGHLNKVSQAIECLEEALRIDKNHDGQHEFSLSLNLAEFYRRDNQTLKAIALLESFLPRNDENLHFNIARCYADLQDYEKSINHYTKAIEINPKDMYAIYNLANQQAAIGSFRLALKYYMLAYEGGVGDAGINLAQIYSSMDRLDDSISLYKELEKYYFNDSNFYFNYANTLRYANEYHKANDTYHKAISLNNDPRYILNLSYLLLSTKATREAFGLYEYRKLLLNTEINKHFLSFSFTNINDLLSFIKDKKVAIYHEQGFGDSIMFVRFLTLLECREILLCVPKELLALFECFSTQYKHITCTNIMGDNYDIAIPIPSLPYLLFDENMESTLLHFRKILLNATKSSENLNLLEIKNKEVFINSNKVLQSYDLDATKNPNVLVKEKNAFVASFKHQDKIPKIGLNFASNSGFQYAREKSIYPRKLLETLPNQHCQYFSLQYEGIDKGLADEFNIIDLSPHIKDFSNSARIILEMDLIISIDSALAHLSATLGKQTALLLHKRHDWRWGRFIDKETTWYDCMFLFKQTTFNDWGVPLKKLRIFIENFIHSYNRN